MADVSIYQNREHYRQQTFEELQYIRFHDLFETIFIIIFHSIHHRGILSVRGLIIIIICLL